MYPVCRKAMAAESNGQRAGFVTRRQWGARKEKDGVEALNVPVPYVVIHHTATEDCTTISDCMVQARYIQDFHMDSNGWSDVGYNFMVAGDDGLVYEARGWTKLGAHVKSYNRVSIVDLNIVSRRAWVAERPTHTTNMTTPIGKVLIVETSTEGCITDCIRIIRHLQTDHKEGRSLWDIRYNFLVGGDGKVYEGRGWSVVGAAVPECNQDSIGICFVGTFSTEPPPEKQIKAAERLIAFGVSRGYIKPNYKVAYASQINSDGVNGVRSSDKLDEVVRSWPHWSNVDYLNNDTLRKEFCQSRYVSTVQLYIENKAESSLLFTRYPDVNIIMVPKWIDRKTWLSGPAAPGVPDLQTPVPYVTLHHTASEPCSILADCKAQMQFIQRYQMKSNNWLDIGYNFLVGGDGYIYEGRNWTKQGANTTGYDDKAISIAFIGLFDDVLPTNESLLAAQEVIRVGLEWNYIRKDYKLFWMRQLSKFGRPGKKLYELIKTWPHWSEKTPPLLYEDLGNLKKVPLI
ncbi:peptidoglycan recognition protein [Holotrichia oblita]|uniref:Peptidoglycan recognition protein n=2 Tax=Holotrichia oblita TaxID=644536 RepID=A0ACB9TY33_HOLOL|nr:peptidoglycan recognition protein [Holotrichia oblita]